MENPGKELSGLIFTGNSTSPSSSTTKTRREFLGLSAVAGIGLTLTACAPAEKPVEDQKEPPASHDFLEAAMTYDGEKMWGLMGEELQGNYDDKEQFLGVLKKFEQKGIVQKGLQFHGVRVYEGMQYAIYTMLQMGQVEEQTMEVLLPYVVGVQNGRIVSVR